MGGFDPTNEGFTDASGHTTTFSNVDPNEIFKMFFAGGGSPFDSDGEAGNIFGSFGGGAPGGPSSGRRGFSGFGGFPGFAQFTKSGGNGAQSFAYSFSTAGG